MAHTLSVASLFVVARSSSFTYKGPVDVKHVANEPGVRYVLEGSTRRDGERVRISAQLVDAQIGNHLWADRYDRTLTDVFAVQDEITRAVVIAIRPAIAEAEHARAIHTPTANLNAWEDKNDDVTCRSAGELEERTTDGRSRQGCAHSLRISRSAEPPLPTRS